MGRILELSWILDEDYWRYPEGILDACLRYLRRILGYLGSILEVSWKYLGRILEGSQKYLGRIFEGSWGITEVSWKDLGRISEVSRKDLERQVDAAPNSGWRPSPAICEATTRAPTLFIKIVKSGARSRCDDIITHFSVFKLLNLNTDLQVSYKFICFFQNGIKSSLAEKIPIYFCWIQIVSQLEELEQWLACSICQDGCYVTDPRARILELSWILDFEGYWRYPEGILEVSRKYLGRISEVSAKMVVTSQIHVQGCAYHISHVWSIW